MSKALVVIDIQNDYFANGRFPLWNADATAAQAVRAIELANAKGIPVVLVQHLAHAGGKAPLLNAGTDGAELHPSIRAAAPDAPIVTKEHADAFEKTTLEETLAGLGATELLVCGMMTHNCVTHTAISRSAEKYDVAVVADACTTVTEILHQIALHAVSTRMRLTSLAEAL